jgi:hypothetical protein
MCSAPSQKSGYFGDPLFFAIISDCRAQPLRLDIAPLTDRGFSKITCVRARNLEAITNQAWARITRQEKWGVGGNGYPSHLL